jgi:hypothetical protein
MHGGITQGRRGGGMHSPLKYAPGMEYRDKSRITGTFDTPYVLPSKTILRADDEAVSKAKEHAVMGTDVHIPVSAVGATPSPLFHQTTPIVEGTTIAPPKILTEVSPIGPFQCVPITPETEPQLEYRSNTGQIIPIHATAPRAYGDSMFMQSGSRTDGSFTTSDKVTPTYYDYGLTEQMLTGLSDNQKAAMIGQPPVLKSEKETLIVPVGKSTSSQNSMGWRVILSIIVIIAAFICIYVLYNHSSK